MKNLKILPKLWLFLIVAICYIPSQGIAKSENDKIIFTNVKVEEALLKAKAEGKLVFMDFYANWCTPCKWMEQTTFTDDRVATKLNANFISVKVNIDDVEGFQMKNRYAVNFLPTMLILNSKGKMVERIEQTMVAEELIGILDMHNSPENKVVIKHDFNTSPKRINSPEDQVEEDPWTISRDDYRRYAETSEKRNYRAQVGVFTDFGEAQKEVARLREEFMEPIVVLNEYRDEKVQFKVVMGQFETLSEASSFCKILLTNFDIKAIVN